MAGIIYTSFSFLGNNAVEVKIEEWRNSLRSIQNLDNLAEQEAKLREVYYSGYEGEIDFGASSVDYKGDFHFESRFSPPLGIQDRILLLLAEIDPNVVVSICYNKDDATEGYRYIVLDKFGEIFDNALGEVDGSDLDCVEIDEDDEDDEDQEHGQKNEAMIEFRLNQLEAVRDLAEDFKGSRAYLKSEIKWIRREISDLKKQKS